MKTKVDLLYGDLTHRIRGAIFNVHKNLGSGQKESVYHKALAVEFRQQCIEFKEEPSLPINYNGVKVGVYKPDFLVEGKIILELKVVPYLVKNHFEQMKHYLIATTYQLGLLVNFETKRAQIRRIIYEKAKT